MEAGLKSQAYSSLCNKSAVDSKKTSSSSTIKIRPKIFLNTSFVADSIQALQQRVVSAKPKENDRDRPLPKRGNRLQLIVQLLTNHLAHHQR
jgi:hypothetical protein